MRISGRAVVRESRACAPGLASWSFPPSQEPREAYLALQIVFLPAAASAQARRPSGAGRYAGGRAWVDSGNFSSLSVAELQLRRLTLATVKSQSILWRCEAVRSALGAYLMTYIVAGAAVLGFGVMGVITIGVYDAVTRELRNRT
jgi:hypothetical protein